MHETEVKGILSAQNGIIYIVAVLMAAFIAIQEANAIRCIMILKI